MEVVRHVVLLMSVVGLLLNMSILLLKFNSTFHNFLTVQHFTLHRLLQAQIIQNAMIHVQLLYFV